MDDEFLPLQEEVIRLITGLSHPEYSSGTLQPFPLVVPPQTYPVIFLENESHNFTALQLVIQTINGPD